MSCAIDASDGATSLGFGKMNRSCHVCMHVHACACMCMHTFTENITDNDPVSLNCLEMVSIRAFQSPIFL